MARAKLGTGATVPVGVKIPAELKTELDRQAKAAGMTFSEFVRFRLAGGTPPVVKLDPSVRPVTAAERAKLTKDAAAARSKMRPGASTAGMRPAARRCECPKPKPAVTGYGVCRGCKKPRLP